MQRGIGTTVTSDITPCRGWRVNSGSNWTGSTIAVRSMGAASDVGDYDEYDRSASSSSLSSSRVERIEAELVRIDDAVRTMKYKLDSQMEVMDMLVDNRGISPTSSFDEDAGLRIMRGPLLRPPPLPFVASPLLLPRGGDTPMQTSSTMVGHITRNVITDEESAHHHCNDGWVRARTSAVRDTTTTR